MANKLTKGKRANLVIAMTTLAHSKRITDSMVQYVMRHNPNMKERDARDHVTRLDAVRAR